MRFIKLSLAIGLGLIVLLFSLLLAFFAFQLIITILPFLAIFSFGIIAVIVSAFTLWAILYGLIMISLALYYFLKPMKVSKKKGSYSIKNVKESGKRTKSNK